MPDEELLAHAAAGDLHRPEVLAAQARRMLRDDRVRGLATEFGGNWLDFRRFEEHNGVDRERFPSFDDELRQAMFEEPVRFFLDLVQRRPLGARLPRRQAHVRQPGPGPALRHARARRRAGRRGSGSTTRRRYGRGGLLPMAVFLTKNSPGLRTSPVKRGYWVVRRLLGEHIPPPPPNVPELPERRGEARRPDPREALARHRADKSCAGCHERFDSIGLAFEGYGPVGERRDAGPRRPAGGHPRDLPRRRRGDRARRACAPTSREQRQDEFVENLCRKLLAYALGRSLHPLGRRDRSTPCGTRLAADGHRFGSLVESDRHQPAVPEQASRSATRRSDRDDHERIRAGTRPGRPPPGDPADLPPRAWA